MNAGGFHNYSNRLTPRCFPGRRTGRFFRPYGTGAEAFRSTHLWKRWAMIGRPCGTSAAGTFSSVPECGETPELPEWVGMAMAQSARNEMVTCVIKASYQVGLTAGADAVCPACHLETTVALPRPSSALTAEPGHGVVRRVWSSPYGCRGAGQKLGARLAFWRRSKPRNVRNGFGW